MENPILWLILTLISLYSYIVLAYVIMSWLVSFNIVNRHSNFVRQVDYFLSRMVDPMLDPIRRFLPDLGGIDLSPIVLFLMLQFLEKAIIYLWVVVF